MSTLEEIAALLGFVAFVGVAVLAFLVFQQARHVRRLRDWAGRAPERAAAAAARATETQVSHRDDEEAGEVADEGREPSPEGEVETGPGRVAVARESLRLRLSELNRHLPVDPRLLAAGLVAILAGVAIATAGFGLFGGDGAANGEQDDRADRQERRQQRQQAEPEPADVEVAVLNANGVAGLADRVASDVQSAGYGVGVVGNTDLQPSSVVMYKGSDEAAAELLADDLNDLLGPLDVEQMDASVQAAASGADVALVIGQDDSGI